MSQSGTPQKGQGSVTSEERVAAIKEREELELAAHAERKKKAFFVMVALVASVFFNVVLIYLAFWHFPQTQYAWTSNVSAVCKMPALKEPFVASQEAVSMAKDAAIGIYSYDHQNFRTTTNMVADRFFTADFKDKFIVKFGQSANLQAVRDNYYVVTAVTNDRKPPQLQRKGVDFSGRYFWEVAIPLNVYYSASRKVLSEKVLARVTVVREVPSARNTSGIAVDNITTEQYIDTP